MPNVMSCAWMCLQVRDLVRRAAVQVGAARAQQRIAVASSASGRRRRRAARRDLDQPELDVVDRQRLLGRARRSAAAPRPRALSARACRSSVNAAAAMRDGDVERGLDLPQVRVERPAQVRERAIVERRERQSSTRDGLSHWIRCQRDGAMYSAPPSSPTRSRRPLTDPWHQIACRTIGAFSASSSVLSASARCAVVSLREAAAVLGGRDARGAARAPSRAAASARRRASSC